MLAIIIGACILALVLRPRKTTTKTRIVAILTTAIPIIIVAIALAVIQMIYNAAGNNGASSLSYTCLIIALSLIGVAIIASTGFTFMRKIEIAKGIVFGICIVIFICSIEWIWLDGLA
ncbi:MAG: hypothetical protein NTV30_04905 [Chloroflexi bacterium]|nr:hypothetical protein [Chloroflexota bacterium]